MEYKQINYKFKNYPHFDPKIHSKSKHEYISCKSNIESHAFYPFIHYNIEFKKYSSIEGKKKKNRDIFYSSHIDRYIYQYYSFYLNTEYNKYLKEHNLDNTVTAYRTNLNRSNIHFASEVFKFIKSKQNVYIIVGDFEKFFDSLGHKNLKSKLAKVVNSVGLENDLYSVFKSLTKYSFIELGDIKEYYLKERNVSKRKLKTIDQYFKDEFNELKKRFIKSVINEPNFEEKGIPQGTPLSGVLANIYMIEFDQKMSEYAKAYNGIYRRYSDDFIIVIEQSVEISELYRKMESLIEADNFIKIQSDKISIYKKTNDELTELQTGSFVKICDNAKIDYLGFTFDLNKICLRSKTISKYFYKAYGYIEKEIKIEDNQRRKGIRNKRNKRRIFEKYSTQLSKHRSRKSNYANTNFITYVKNSSRIMRKYNLSFDDQGFISNHKNKLIKRLSNRPPQE